MASDFRVTGLTPVTVVGATGNCVNGVTTSIFVQPHRRLIQTAGNYQIILQPGNDGNTIIDECGQQRPPALALYLYYSRHCKMPISHLSIEVWRAEADTLHFAHNAANNVNQWQWDY